MARHINISKKNIIVALIAISVLYCISPYIDKIYREAKNITITIENITPQGRGSEVWLAETTDTIKYYNLNNIDIDSEINGEAEYRDKDVYGYGYNFFISYGDNIGSKIKIETQKDSSIPIVFWKNPSGGIVKVSIDEYSTNIDLFAPGESGGEIVSIYPIKGEQNSGWMLKVIKIICLMLMFVIIYLIDKGLKVICKDYVLIKEKDNDNLGANRVIGIDIVRSIAVIFVISVHFFLGCQYYNMPLVGKSMFVMTWMRWLFLCCVPLFMMLTGFLKKNKTVDWKHYRTLKPILASYLIILVLKLIIDRYYHGISITLSQAIKSIISFEYAWYINMYIGIFILIPFLNIMWNQLDKNKKEILLISLISLTALSTVTNNMISNYWQSIYPITYYYLGCYLKDHEVRINKVINVSSILILVTLQAILTYGACGGGYFDWNLFGGYNCSYNGLVTIFLTLLIFILFQNVSLKNKWICKIIKCISECSLEIYLLSSLVVDQFIYSWIRNSIDTPRQWLEWFFVVIMLSLVISASLAIIIKRIVNKALK